MENQASKTETEIANAKRDIDRIATELTELMYDFKDHKDKATRDALQGAALMELEIMQSQLESTDIY